MPQRTAVGAPTHGALARMRLLVASGIWLARLPDSHCWRRRAPAPSYSRYQRLQRLKRPPPPFHAPQRPTTDTLDCPVAPAPLPLRVPASSTRKCPPSLLHIRTKMLLLPRVEQPAAEWAISIPDTSHASRELERVHNKRIRHSDQPESVIWLRELMNNMGKKWSRDVRGAG